MNKFDYIRETNRLNEIISLEINKYITRELSQELTTKQHLCIIYLGNVKRANTAKIADILDISKSSNSQLLRRLEREDLISREINVDNRKEVFVLLSNKGNKYFKDYESAKDKVFKKLFNNITDEEAKQMLEINRKVLKSIKENTNNWI